MRKIFLAVIGAFVLVSSSRLDAQSMLKGSRSTMERQNEAAQLLDYTFLQTSTDVHRFVERGYLVPVKTTESLKLDGVSFPYARPAVKLFAERLAKQYQSACGNKLVITSLTRPLSRQPYNASDLSVHPAGMAIDIRVSDKRACRSWLENTLVALEKRGVLDATRERFPAHYHVAVFPDRYERYLARLGVGAPATKVATKSTTPKTTTPSEQPKIAKAAEPSYASVVPLRGSSSPTHKVRTGETLWAIARKHGVTVTELKQANDLRTSTIRAGQVLAIPRARGSDAD